MVENRYSKFIFIITAFFSFLKVIQLFNMATYAWITSGIALVVLTTCNISSDYYIKRIVINIRINSILKFLFFTVLAVVFYYDSISKLISLFYMTPVDIQYFLLVPLLIFTILIAGAVIGLLHKIYDSIYL